MGSIGFHPKALSLTSPSRTTTAPSTPTSQHGAGSGGSLSDSAINKIIQEVAKMVKWNPKATAYARVTSLFYENKIKCVNGLKRAMDALVFEDSAQSLMQIVMKRLQEFYHILSMN